MSSDRVVARWRREPLFGPGGRVAVLGLGASGFAAAKLAAALGAEVYASDTGTGPELRGAREELAGQGITAELGRHDLDKVLGSDLVVTSPGIPSSAPVRGAVAGAAVAEVAEVELAFRALQARVIGVTGTNGKTTVTELTARVLAGAGIGAPPSGNAGRPLSEVAMTSPQPPWTVVELSSFQLSGTRDFRCDIGALLNLAPDHLDAYSTVGDYYRDKARIFGGADPDSRWVINADDNEVCAMAAGVAGESYVVSLEAHDLPGAYLDQEEMLSYRPAPGSEIEHWGSAGGLRLHGRHNIHNALTAGVLARLAGASTSAISRGLASFGGLPHRMAVVGEWEGVQWINDSKATNVAAVVAAVRGLERPYCLLLGGRHKGEAYGGLADALGPLCRMVIAYGEAGRTIESDLGSSRTVLRAGSLAEAVEKARAAACAGDVVLLSPACSSYDEFRNYEARGREFERLARPGGENSAGEEWSSPAAAEAVL